MGSTKKQTVLSMVFISCGSSVTSQRCRSPKDCVVNIAIPQAFHKAPYKHGLLTVLAMMVAYVVINIVLFTIGQLENARRNARSMEDSEPEVHTSQDIQDETDKRNPRFRYAF